MKTNNLNPEKKYKVQINHQVEDIEYSECWVYIRVLSEYHKSETAVDEFNMICTPETHPEEYL